MGVFLVWLVARWEAGDFSELNQALKQRWRGHWQWGDKYCSVSPMYYYMLCPYICNRTAVTHRIRKYIKRLKIWGQLGPILLPRHLWSSIILFIPINFTDAWQDIHFFSRWWWLFSDFSLPWEGRLQDACKTTCNTMILLSYSFR